MSTSVITRTKRSIASLTALVLVFMLSAQTLLAATDYSGLNAVGVNVDNAEEAIALGGGVATMALDGGSLSVSGFSGVAGQTIKKVTLGMVYTRLGNASPHDDRIVLGYTIGGVNVGSSKPSFNPTTGALKTTTFNITGDRAWTPEDIDQLDVTVSTETAGGVPDANSVQIDHLYLTVNYAPTASNLAITPANPHDDQDLVLSYDYFDANNDPESLEIGDLQHTLVRWQRKNVGQANFQTQVAHDYMFTVPAADTAPGQQWRFIVRPNDGQVNGATYTSAPVTVRTNTAPVLNAIGAQSTYETDALNFNISATDEENDPLTYSAADLPAGATLSADGAFSWTPTFDQQPHGVNGTYDVTFFANDTYGGSDSEVVTITVFNLDRTPVLDPIGPQTVNENEALAITMNATDADGGDLMYYTIDLPDGATFNEETGVFNWTPGFNQAGVYPVEFHVDDGYGAPDPGERQNSGHDSEVVQITVNNINRDPVLNAVGNQTVDENAELSVQLVASDEDAEVLTYSIVNQPAGSDFNTNTGLFTWTPSYAQSGIYPVTFGVTDGISPKTEDITITVNNVNRAPVLAAVGNRATSEGIQVTVQLSGTDDDGDLLTYSIVNQPAGSSFDSNTGLFTWTPDPEQGNLNDTNYNLTFGVSDVAASVTEDVVISVGNVDRPPELAALGDQTVDENTALNFNVSANDPDAQAVTLSAANLPAGATFNTETGAFSWTPTYEQAGVYENITFTATSGDPSLTDTTTISITVNNVNRVPVLEAVGDKSTNVGVELQIQLAASDADGEALTYSFDGDNVAGASINGETGLFTWTPTVEQIGSHSVTFSANDGADSGSETITITVADRAPTLTPIGDKSGTTSQLMSFSVSATDPDGQQVAITADLLPNGASFNGSQFTWTPLDRGEYIITFRATSGEPALIAVETITIRLENPANIGIIGVGNGSSNGGGSVSSSGGETVVFTPTPTPAPAPSPTPDPSEPIEPTPPTPPTTPVAVLPTPPEVAPSGTLVPGIGTSEIGGTVTESAGTTDNDTASTEATGGTTAEPTTPTAPAGGTTDGNTPAPTETATDTATGSGSNATPVTALAQPGTGSTPTANNSNEVGTQTPTPTPSETTPNGVSADSLQASVLGAGSGSGEFDWSDFALSAGGVLIALGGWYVYQRQQTKNSGGK